MPIHGNLDARYSPREGPSAGNIDLFRSLEHPTVAQLGTIVPLRVLGDHKVHATC